MNARQRILSSAAGALLAIAPRADTQTVHGTVVVNGEPAGVVGAVVLMLDGGGGVLARTLTDDGGRFSLRVAQPGGYRLRAMRIGLRPITTRVLTLARDTTVVLAMPGVTAPLPAVTTREQTQCNFRPDSTLALGSLWEDAKTALLAAAITREQSDYRFDFVDHERTYDIATGELRAVQTSETRSYGNRAWVSLPPERLRRDGYVIEERDSTLFAAPDIETLLSAYFVDTHCFRLASNPGPDSLVGVEFSPARKVDHAEVRGTLWVDRRSHELRSVDFHYVNLIAADSLAGGSVAFTRLSTGAWVMTDWSIRAPLLHVFTEYTQQNANQPAPPISRRGAPRTMIPIFLAKHLVVADQLRVYGGTLRDVLRDSLTIWALPPRALDVHVTTGFARTPPNGDETTIYLRGTGRSMNVDSTGSARFDGLVHGAYLVDVGTRQLDVLGWPRAHAQVDIGRAPVATAEINLAAPLDAARSMCGDDAKLLSDHTGVLIGAVTRGDEPLGHRDVTLSWSTQDSTAAEPPRGASLTVQTLSGDGRFLACGIPRDREITVHVVGTNATRTARLASDQVVGIADVALTP